MRFVAANLHLPSQVLLGLVYCDVQPIHQAGSCHRNSTITINYIQLRASIKAWFPVAFFRFLSAFADGNQLIAFHCIPLPLMPLCCRMAEPKESKEERFVELFNSFIQPLVFTDLH